MKLGSSVDLDLEAKKPQAFELNVYLVLSISLVTLPRYALHRHSAPLDQHIDKLQISNIILQPKSCQHLSTAGKVTGADIRFLNPKSKLGKS